MGKNVRKTKFINHLLEQFALSALLQFYPKIPFVTLYRFFYRKIVRKVDFYAARMAFIVFKKVKKFLSPIGVPLECVAQLHISWASWLAVFSLSIREWLATIISMHWKCSSAQAPVCVRFSSSHIHSFFLLFLSMFIYLLHAFDSLQTHDFSVFFLSSIFRTRFGFGLSYIFKNENSDYWVFIACKVYLRLQYTQHSTAQYE